jgi:hypothetical protein
LLLIRRSSLKKGTRAVEQGIAGLWMGDGTLRESMPEPSLDRRGDALYLVDRDGNNRRIHDAKYTGGRAHRLVLGATAANARHFVAADGTQRTYTFERDRRRDTTPEVLEHLNVAGFCSLEPFDPGRR